MHKVDLLDHVPDPEDVRRKLVDAVRRAAYLRGLLRMAERLHVKDWPKNRKGRHDG